MNITHHFAGGAYAKESRFKAGEAFAQHSHPHDHLAILAKGSAVVSRENVIQRFEAPACITLEANTEHGVTAATDMVWFCIWATDDTDSDTVDTTILRGN